MPINISVGSGLPLWILVTVTLIIILRKLSRIYSELRTTPKPANTDNQKP